MIIVMYLRSLVPIDLHFVVRITKWPLKSNKHSHILHSQTEKCIKTLDASGQSLEHHRIRVYGIIYNAQYLHVTQIPFRQERKTMAQKTRHESQSAHQGKAPENSTSSLPPDRRKHFVAICLQLLTNFGEKKTRSSAKSVCYKKPHFFFRLRSKTLCCSIISQTHFNKPPNPFGDPEISLCVCVCVSVRERKESN